MEHLIGYLGIDAAKSYHVVHIKDAHKRSLIPSLTIDDDSAGYQRLRQCLDTLKEKHSITVFRAGVEATGTYHCKLVEQLRQWNDVAVTIINPIQTSHYLRSDLRRASTDKASAEIIALYLVEKQPVPTHFQAQDYETAKHLAKHLHGLTKQKTATINRLRELVALLWPEYERKYHNYNTLQVLAFLTIAQTPQQARLIDWNSMKKVTVGGKEYTLRSDFISDIQILATESQPRLISLTLEPVIRSLAEQILFLLSQIDTITDQLKQLFTDNTSDSAEHHSPLLSTIGGIGDLSAMLFTAWIGDVERFQNGKQLKAYFGVDPRVRESGTSIHGRGYIQKRGSSIVRYYLFNCVLTMIRMKRHPIAKFYQRLVDRGKTKMVALVACMSKLVGIMYAMLKSNKPFSLEYGI